MTKAVAANSKRAKPVPKRAYGHRVLARLPDGVLLLAPATKPESFTTREIRATIRQVLRDRKAAESAAGGKSAD